MSNRGYSYRTNHLIHCLNSSRTCVIAQSFVSEAESLCGVVNRRQSSEENRNTEEHISPEMERHVHGAGDADFDLAVSHLRSFQLSQGLADGRANSSSSADSAAL